jgi:hypothetical protein
MTDAEFDQICQEIVACDVDEITRYAAIRPHELRAMLQLACDAGVDSVLAASRDRERQAVEARLSGNQREDI